MKKLNTYNKKRNFNNTKEPIGKENKSLKKLKFVVQHHMARKEHYDLRLEWDGVLKSWAVPKGPSYDSKDKRLAIMVEDHPMEYRNFEGIIPKGEYGGGTVMIWDEGYWEPISDDVTFDKILKFKLYGKRLKGTWSLVPFKDENWLLIKEVDSYKGYKDIKIYRKSIKSGLTMKELENEVKKINITNPDKIIFKKEGITKLDIVKYYEKVAERMLPFIENRIISTVRCPNGVSNGFFFKKHLEKINHGMGMIRLSNDSNNKEDYYYIKNINGLISEVQMNSFEYHIWGSNINKLEKPNIIVFDLDPDKGLSLDKVRKGVKDLKSILDELQLKSFLKTSGGKGYHVVVPINTKSWKEIRKISKDIAKVMEERWPNKYTSNMRKINRKDKIFIDWVRNTKGSTTVAPYSIRIKTASVSMPIKWSELDKVKPDEIKMEDAIKRTKRKNPWEDFFE